MTISRRAFLQGTAAGAASLCAGPQLLASEAGRFANPLKIPGMMGQFVVV